MRLTAEVVVPVVPPDVVDHMASRDRGSERSVCALRNQTIMQRKRAFSSTWDDNGLMFTAQPADHDTTGLPCDQAPEGVSSDRKVLEGVRIVEVAEHTFVPAASALLSDLGAEVVKIEHVQRGDAMRGLASTGMALVPGDVHALLEHSNRGKKSLGLDLTPPDGLDILYQLTAHHRRLPHQQAARACAPSCSIDVDDVRAHNPNIIYVRGTGQGERGPDADKGSYDSLAFWARAGVAPGAQRPEYDLTPGAAGAGLRRLHRRHDDRRRDHGRAVPPGAHRRGDRRRRVAAGAPACGPWARPIALSLVLGPAVGAAAARRSRRNPLSRTYTTERRSGPRVHLPAGRQVLAATLCDVIGRPELATDPRFADHAVAHGQRDEAIAILTDVFASATLDEWRKRLEPFTGQWAVVQDTLEAAVDPQTVANGYMQDCETAVGHAVPAGGRARAVRRASRPRPHGRPSSTSTATRSSPSLGIDWDTVVDLKVRGVVA